MTICFFGNYISDYPRIATLRQGLVQSGVKVIECHTRKTGIAKYIDLYKQHTQIKNQYDFILVSMGAYTLTWFAKLLSKKRVLFDAFVSMYLTNVEDRKIAKKRSLKARYYKLVEKFGCRFADKVLLDTNAQIEYFVKSHNISRDKFIRVLVSADDSIYFPKSHKSQATTSFIVHWHGHIVPFHGTEVILEAAEKLMRYKNIKFQFVTRFTDRYKNLKKICDSRGVTNIQFYPETDYEGLAHFINGADITLGVFSDNKKAQVVVPNKIVEAAACKKVSVTAKTGSVLEVFDDESIIFVPSNSADELVKAVLKLYNDRSTREQLSHRAYEIYKNKLTPMAVATELIKVLEKI